MVNLESLICLDMWTHLKGFLKGLLQCGFHGEKSGEYGHSQNLQLPESKLVKMFYVT